MAYSPNLPPGQATASGSEPVVLASDATVSTDLDQDRVLHDIAVAVQAIAASKGVASDLRVFVDNTVTAAQATAASLNATVVQATGTSLHSVVDNVFMGGTPTSAVPQSIQNVAYSNAFSQNITRP